MLIAIPHLDHRTARPIRITTDSVFLRTHKPSSNLTHMVPTATQLQDQPQDPCAIIQSTVVDWPIREAKRSALQKAPRSRSRATGLQSPIGVSKLQSARGISRNIYQNEPQGFRHRVDGPGSPGKAGIPKPRSSQVGIQAVCFCSKTKNTRRAAEVDRKSTRLNSSHRH